MARAPFPEHRPRRLRRGVAIRDAVAETRLSIDDLICPLFVKAGGASKPVPSMPGVDQLPVNEAVGKIRRLAERGLRRFILFGVTPAEEKDPEGRFAASADAPVNQVLARVAEHGIDAVLIADTCFCEYTDHGHCGALAADDPGATVDNDRTLALLGETAVAQARAGAHFVAPSGMMDGQVAAIRRALDDAGFPQTGIIAYSAKYASHFYGPFRDAGEGGMAFGDRKGYQMDFRRCREWRMEIDHDLAEGADAVMVKPATPYLDVIRGARERVDVPVAAYHVSGEYAMLCAAAERGWLDFRSAAIETLTGIKRAGADLILTYLAPFAAEWQADGGGLRA